MEYPNLDALDDDGPETDDADLVTVERIQAQPTLDDDDFSDLEAIVEEGRKAAGEEKQLREARKRLAKISKLEHASKEDEKFELLRIIRALEEKRVWNTVGNVALFHTQTCAECNAQHSLFMGWFTEQAHVSDPQARRLLAGHTVERLPERREDHDYGTVEVCTACIEWRIAVDNAVDEAVAI